MSEYTEFFLNNTGQIVQLETLQIHHPDFTRTYRVVRNAPSGITATDENGDPRNYEYYPLVIKSLGARADLDQGFQVVLGDLSEVLPVEIDEVSSADSFDVKPTVTYRTYRSDNLTDIMFGPLFLEAATFSFNRTNSTFEIRAPQLNINKTGELYKLERFPMLRGFL